MHEILVNRLGGLSLPRKSVVRLTDRPDMTLDVYHGRKTTTTSDSLLPNGHKNSHLSETAKLISVSEFGVNSLQNTMCQLSNI